MKAVYCGSFDPFTNGHLDITRQACDIFDEVHIVIARNMNKSRAFTEVGMEMAIKESVVDISNCKVVCYDGMTADYCAENNIKYIVRGLRNNMDYNYEENIAMVNQELNPGLKTVYLRAENKCISSTMVRELLAHNRSVSKYLPPAVNNIIHL